MIYNAILRHFPAWIFDVFKETNLFPTSIHVLQSAVSKIARSTKIPTGLKLYRGLSMALPKEFNESDLRGCRGFAEWGFMSTTADRAVAIQYSGVKDAKEAAKVLEIRTSSVNRGACIMAYSQYPGECEYLWPPLAFLESSGGIRKEATEHGVLTVVDLLVCANLKSSTCDEIEKQKKTLHLAAFTNLLAETTRDLARIAEEERAEDRLARDPLRMMDLQDWLSSGGRLEWLLQGMTEEAEVTFTVAGLQNRIVEQCKAVFARHAALPPERYNTDSEFRHIVAEFGG
jgi:hypothetical protein